MKRLLWLDLETTGLDPLQDLIMSVGMIVTDTTLNEIASVEYDIHGTFNLNIKNTDVRVMHRELLQRCEKAPFGLMEARTLVKAFILQHGGDKPFLAGNSIHFDKEFLRQGFPNVLELCHYRMLDVSVFKVMAELWHSEYVPELHRVAGTAKHTPLEDIRAGLRQLTFIQEMLKWSPVPQREI